MKKQTAKKYIRRGLILAVLLTGFLCVTGFLNYLFSATEDWQRYILHCFYERDEPIDRLWLGSSHVYRDIDPDIMDALSGEANFNLSTSSQSLTQSYLLLREADKRFHPNHVYLEMCFSVNLAGYTCYDISNFFRIWDYMPFSFQKICSISEQHPKEEMIAVFLPFTRFRNYLFDYTRTRNLYGQKQNNYRSNLTEEYSENGYAKTPDTYLKSYILSHSVPREETTLSESARQSLLEIIEYCDTEDIPLTLFSSPVSALELRDVGDYDQYVTEIITIAEEHDLKYYDFNLCRQEYLPLQDSEHFKDADHLNSIGVELFTPVLYDVITNDRTEYFYDSYEEKLRETPPALYGLIANGTDEEGRVIYTIASNREDELEYRVTFIPDSRHENSELIQDYSTGKEFHFSSDQEGVFMISARPVGESEAVLEVEIQK